MAKLTERARDLRNNPTEAEKLFWSKVKHEQLGFKFRRQHPIDHYIADFYVPDLQLIIELDGGQHNENQKDEIRTKYLESKGCKIIRFWNNEVLSNIEGVLETLLLTLKALPPNPPSRKQEGGLNRDHLPPPARGRGDKGGRDLSSRRLDFPILAKQMNGQPVTFLDTASSAQKPQVVIDAMRDVMENHYANIHRGLYEFSQTTTTEYEAVRSKVAGFIGAETENEIIFTRNTTEAINLVAYSWGRKVLERGDDVVITEMEHHANIVPWQLICGMTGAKLKVVPVKDDGTVDLAAFERIITQHTKIVSFVHISNALGTINPARRMVEIAKAKNPEVTVLVDGSQSAVHGSVNVQNLGCDFFVFTGHKLYGPTGIGVLWGRADILEAMPPYQGGGDMIEQVTFEKTTFKEAPAKFEAGTPAIIEVIGLGAAIDYVQDIGMDAIAAHERSLFEYAMKELEAIPGLTFYGTSPDKAGIISFRADWGHPSDIGMILDQCGVAVRTGHHCCQPLMKRFAIDATVRASFGLYSNKDDVDALVAALKKARSLLS